MRRTDALAFPDHALRHADSWMRELAQRHADDVVLAAALFKPNAVGNHELSWGGFGQRQLLKARGAYLAERTVLAVTPLEVVAVALSFGDRVERKVRCWRRGAMSVACVVAHGRAWDVAWPAVLITNRSGRMAAEVQPLHADAESGGVTALLLGNHCPAR